MFKQNAKCSVCEKEIQESEKIYVKMRSPESKGMVEVKAFLQNEGKIICERCIKK